MKKVMDIYTEVCDLFMIKKADEIRNKSDKFMEFFVAFFNDVQKAMPKIEEPKKERKGGASLRAAAKKAGAMNMMAELKAVQAR